MDEVDRLIEAIVRSDVKRLWLAAEVGIGKSTLSRIEKGEKKNVDVRLFNRLVRALGEQPSTFLGEPESPFLTWDLQKIREAVVLLYEKFVRPEPVRAEPNAQFLAGNVSRRRGITVPADPKRVAKRYRAAATPTARRSTTMTRPPSGRSLPTTRDSARSTSSKRKATR